MSRASGLCAGAGARARAAGHGGSGHPILLAFALAFALGGSNGCANALGQAEAEFASGEYPRAQARLAALEPESRSWSDPDRAAYALYRGLSYAALGDVDRAGRWLREARAIEGAHPGALPPADRQRLAAGLESTAAAEQAR